MPFELRVHHNMDYTGGTESPRYFFDLDLSAILPRQALSSIPVYWQPLKASLHLIKEVYWTELAGVRLEKGNLEALKKAVPEAVAGMVSFGTFPYYFFTVPSGERLPAYHSEGKLRLKPREGGVFTGEEVGELWHRVADHLVAQKKLAQKEKLEVSLLLWKDLKLYPTALVLRDGKVWIPLFYSAAEGKLLYDIIGIPTRFLEVEAAFELRQELAQSLVASRTVSSTFDVHLDWVSPEVWQGMGRAILATGFALSYFRDGEKVVLPLYRVRGEVFALESQSRLKLLFSASIEEAPQQVAAALRRQGKLPSSSTLTLEKIL